MQEAERATGRRDKNEQAPRQATGALLAIVALEEQTIHVYDRDGLVTRSRVSTGAPGYRTPTGVFSVLQKNRYHESNIYSAAPMPYMQRLTWSGIALHAGVVPNRPASHGCVRLTYEFAPKLWAMSRLGMRVIVTPHEIEPYLIKDARLPVALMTPASVGVAGNGKDAPAPLELAAGQAADTKAVLSDRNAVALAAPKMESPIDRARSARKRAAEEAAAAEKAVKPALELARRTAVEAGKARALLRRAQQASTAADARLMRIQTATQSAKPQNADRLTDAGAAAEEAADKARQALADATAVEAAKSAEANAAAAAVKIALEAKSKAAEVLAAASRALEPVSVLVTRKDQKLFVRQGGEPVFDAQIKIRSPDQPIGTHVFTAMAATDGEPGLRWIVARVPDAGSGRIAAAEALERIEIPQDVMTKVGDRLWTGASFIISDQPISRETGRGTDFVLLTK